jgi:hypothetical protein
MVSSGLLSKTLERAELGEACIPRANAISNIQAPGFNNRIVNGVALSRCLHCPSDRTLDCMKLDPLRQYAKLRHQLLEEKSKLEARLSEINQVLGSDEVASSAPPKAATAPKPAGRAGGRGRRGGNKMSLREAIVQALAKGPMNRQELVDAVKDLGYVFNTKDPANSMGVILYGKKSPFKKQDGKFCLPSSSTAVASSAAGKNGRAPKKRTMSSEGRARISAAQKARWAKLKRGS